MEITKIKIQEGYLRLTEKFHDFYDKYGVLAVIAAAAALLKVILFYGFVNVTSNRVIVCLITCCFIYLLFKMFKNKWIPAVIYLLISILMFCDVTYCSFFNNYLSVNMIGAAGVLGDITESIKEVIQPEFFLMFVDAVLILACLTARRLKQRRNVAAACDSCSKENNGIQDAFEEKSEKDGTEKAESDMDIATSVEVSSDEKKSHIKKKVKQIAEACVCPLIFIALAAMIVINPADGSFIRSISNQEIFSYHIKDIVENGLKKEQTADKGNLSAFEDNYEHEKIGPLFGVAEGRNLIVVQLESFQNFVINREYNGQEITPVINALIDDESIYFDNYYHQTGMGNTSDAEFATNNSIYGSMMSYTNKIYLGNYFRGLPVLLGEKGYETAVFHAYEDLDFWSRRDAYPGLGFRHFYGGLRIRENGGVYENGRWIGWGIADHEFYPQAVEIMKDLQQPFYSFVISLSNHHPFDVPEDFSRLELLPEDEGTIVGRYLDSASYTDWALGEFIEELKQAGLYDNSVIAIYGDHVGLTHNDDTDAQMSEFLGHTYDFNDMMNVPLVIHIPDADHDVQQTVSTAGGQLDFLPTMAYLMGFQELDTIYLGHNLLTEEEGFVAIRTYMPKGSFFSNDIAFEMSRDGVFENSRAWNIHTGKPVDIQQCYDNYLRSVMIATTSDYILNSDALRDIFLEGKSAQEAGSKHISRLYPDALYVAGYPDTKLMGTNSIEALDYSYYKTKYTVKVMRIDVGWDEDSMPVMLNKFTGKTEMTHKELAEWMEEHGDVTIVANVEKSGEWFLTCMKNENPTLVDRIIVEMPSLSEYSGEIDAIVNLSKELRTEKDQSKIYDNLAAKRPWAVTLREDDADSTTIENIAKYTTIYLLTDEDGKYTKID